LAQLPQKGQNVNR